MVRQVHGDIQSDDEPGYRTKIGNRQSSYRCAGSVTLHWIIRTCFSKYKARSLETKIYLLTSTLLFRPTTILAPNLVNAFFSECFLNFRDRLLGITFKFA